MNNALITIRHSKSQQIDQALPQLDISDINIPELREFNAFRKFCSQGLYRGYDYCGLVSPKFTDKTGITVNSALDYIDTSADVILFHPYPLELKVQSHFLQLAELEHPGITQNMQDLWHELFEGEMPRIKLPDYTVFCGHCNYFLANQRFWDAYAGMISKMDQLYEDGKLEEYLSGRTPYTLRTDAEQHVAYFPFMFERLLSHFIFHDKDNFNVKNVCMENDFKPIMLFKHEDLLISLLNKLFLCSFGSTGKTGSAIATRLYYHIRKYAYTSGRV